MASQPRFSNELAFLNRLFEDRGTRYRNAHWLTDDFDSLAWQIVLGQNRIDIDFRARMPDGSCLTDFRHKELLNLFKEWLCIQTHPDVTGGRLLANETIYNRLLRVLHLIDFFLMSGRELRIESFGLSLLTTNDVKRLITQLSTSSKTSESIYCWTSRLSTYLRKITEATDPSERATLIAKLPWLSMDIAPPEERVLGLDDEAIVQARTALYLHNHYTSFTSDFRLAPSSLSLTKEIYKDTIWATKRNAHAPELLLQPKESTKREFPGVPAVNDEFAQPSENKITSYLDALKTLSLLSDSPCCPSSDALQNLSLTSLGNAVILRPSGRFLTLPHYVVFPAIKNALSFSLSYGPPLVDTFLELVRQSHNAGMSVMQFCNSNNISRFIHPKIRDIGASVWSAMPSNGGCIETCGQPEIGFFERLRSNAGVYELLRVLYGSTQIVVGFLSARRQGELIDLIASTCIDKSDSNLLFRNRKSGPGGMRELEARPIPKVAVSLLKEIERLQAGLIDIGVLPKFTNIFAPPAWHGKDPLRKSSSHQLNRSLDFFSDYFQVELDEQGRRYYFRHHQMRRFLAILFFWSQGFAGLDTLRWFLGHTDVEHLYRYVTEATPGAILRNVKATFAADRIRSNDDAFDELQNLIEEHFNTRNVSVLDAQELTDYIEHLMQLGQVSIEPQFMKFSGGDAYRILVAIHPETTNV